jgi:hypothetical protein
VLCLVLVVLPVRVLLAGEPASAPGAPTTLPSTAVVRQAEVELEVEVAPWSTVSGPVALSCVLRNSSQQDVRVYPYGVATMVPSKEPWFRVIVLNEQGYPLEYTQEGIDALHLQRADLFRSERVDIPAGQQFRQDYDLSRWFRFPGPGTYKVEVRRHVTKQPKEELDLRVEAQVRIIDEPDHAK